MEEDREIIDDIYQRLPKEVTDQNENQNLNMRISTGRRVTTGAGPLMVSVAFRIFALYNPIILTSGWLVFVAAAGTLASGIATQSIGNSYINNRINNSEREETIKAIKNSFKTCIEIITKKIITEYKSKNFQNYELIKGENVSNLIDDISKKIIQPEEDSNISIIDLFENIIYGKTPLYSCCKKAFEIFENNDSKNKILFIISDGILTDTYNIISTQNEILNKKLAPISKFGCISL